MGVPKIKGKTLKQWIKHELQPQDNYTPVLCIPEDKAVHGDGLQLVRLTTRAQHGYYWLIQIDSRISLENSDDIEEDLLTAIEEQYGVLEEDDSDLDDDEDDSLKDYPALDPWTSGVFMHAIVNFGLGRSVKFTQYMRKAGVEVGHLVPRAARMYRIEKWQVREQLRYFLEEQGDNLRTEGLYVAYGYECDEDIYPIVDGRYITKIIK
jgi:hypothetical protein